METAVAGVRKQRASSEGNLIEGLRKGELCRYAVEDADLTKFTEWELRELFNRSLRLGNLTPSALLEIATVNTIMTEEQRLAAHLAFSAKRCLELAGHSLRQEDWEIPCLASMGDGDPWPTNPSYEVNPNPPARLPRLGRTA